MSFDTNITPLLEANGISKIYSQGAMAVGLHRFSSKFYRGEFVAITGSSGSGKSTLLNLLSGLDNYDEGELYFKGEPTSHFTEDDRAAYRKDNVAFIFQDYYLLDSYTVFQNIELALLYSMPDPKLRAEKVRELIDKVGLTNHAKQRCSHLSGGQKQRVSIARALAKDAPILFADEPCGNLDSTMTEEVMNLLASLTKDKLVLMVTHSFDEVAPYATRKLRLADGELVEDQVIHEVNEPNEEVQPTTITKKQLAAGLSRVAFNNIKATPKRSFFGIFGLAILTAIFIVGMLISVTVIELPSYNNSHYRYDLQVRRGDGEAISDAELAEIGNMSGVTKVFRNNRMLYESELFEYWDDYYDWVYFRPACNLREADLYMGRKPVAKDEVVICIPAIRRNLSKNRIGSKISSYSNGINNEQTDTFTIVGIVLSSDEMAYFCDEFFQDPQYNMEGNYDIVVTFTSDIDLNRTRNDLIKKGYVVFHMYGDHVGQSTSQVVQLLMAVGLFVAMMLVFRIITGSYRALEASKRKDYNIMRTVGLPNRFVKSIYYVEMAFQGLIGWGAGVLISIVIGIVYGIALTPSITYGFKVMGQYGLNLLWVGALALAADLFVTIGNAVRFNRYFYRQTVKMSLKEGGKQ